VGYFRVAITEGLLDVDYADLIEGIQDQSDFAVVWLRESAAVRDTWEAITEETFDSYRLPAPEVVPVPTLAETQAALDTANTQIAGLRADINLMAEGLAEILMKLGGGAA